MKVDLILRNAELVNVLTSEIYHSDICIKDGIIAGFDGSCECLSEIDCTGKFVAPSFIEGHIHLESTHLMPSQITDIALSNGVTTLICDPHEIANAGGLEGIRFLTDAAADEPADYYFMAPSCVPASDMETSGAKLGTDELRSLLESGTVMGLGEVMDFPSVINRSKSMTDKIRLFDGYVIDGHCPELRGGALDEYISAGIYSDHETEDPDEALEKIRKGMFLMIRSGSMADSSGLLEIINHGNDNRFMIVSDDNSPVDLYHSRYLLYRLRKMAGKTDTMTLIKGLTINPATYFRLHDRGEITPGKKADLLIFDDLDGFELMMTIKDGKPLYEKNVSLRQKIPAKRKDICKMGDFRIRKFNAEDFEVPDKNSDVRVIGVSEGSIITEALTLRLHSSGKTLDIDPGRDIIKCAVIERYSGKCGKTVGFIKGTGLKKGVLASSFNHDAHNIFIAGTDDTMMADAVNRLCETGGGIYFSDGDAEAFLPLSIYGVISTLSIPEVSECVSKIEKLMKNPEWQKAIR